MVYVLLETILFKIVAPLNKKGAWILTILLFFVGSTGNLSYQIKYLSPIVIAIVPKSQKKVR